jgi:predicted nucleotide-binding protein (sugar kinase/HSP70/actin superfamily)
MSTHPIVRIQKDIIRTWLFQLHEQVNQRLSKPSFPVESLTQYEAPFHFTQHVAILHEQMLAAVRQGWSSTEDVQQTIRFLMEMKCFYDFF